MRAVRTALVVTGTAAVAAGFAAYVWWQLRDVELGLHGWLALTLMVVGSAVLWFGLIRLAFYSNRHGHDDRQSGRPGE